MSYVYTLVLVFLLKRLHFPFGGPICAWWGALSIGGKLEYPGATMWPSHFKGKCSPPHVFVNGWSDKYQVLNIPTWSWYWVSTFGNSHTNLVLVLSEYLWKFSYKPGPGIEWVPLEILTPAWSCAYLKDFRTNLVLLYWVYLFKTDFVTGVRQVYALLVLKLV